MADATPPRDVPPAGIGLAAAITRGTGLLAGTWQARITAWVSFAFAFVLSLVAAAQLNDLAGRQLLAFGVMFVVAQTFTLAKTVRDRQTADLPGLGADLLKGNTPWLVQVVAAFGIAVIYTLYTVITTVAQGSWNGEGGAVVMCILFVLSASFTLAKAVRDKADAEMLAAQGAAMDRESYLRILLIVASGTDGYRLVSYLSACGSVLFVIIGTFSLDMVIERKGFILIAVLFMSASGFQLAKLVRDLQDPQLRELNHMAYRALVSGAFVLALAISFGGVLLMPLDGPTRMFLVTGLLFVVFSGLATAKMVRDTQEIAKLRRQVREASGSIV